MTPNQHAQQAATFLEQANDPDLHDRGMKLLAAAQAHALTALALAATSDPQNLGGGVIVKVPYGVATRRG